MCLLRRQQPDRAHAEVLQDLRAEPDLAPLARARRLGLALAVLRQRLTGTPAVPSRRHDDDAAADLLEALQRGVHALARRRTRRR